MTVDSYQIRYNLDLAKIVLFYFGRQSLFSCFIIKCCRPSLPEDEGNNNQSDNILNILLLMGAENFKLYLQDDCEMDNHEIVTH